MKINKIVFKDGLTFLWVAILLFVMANDTIYPILAFVLKVCLYILGFLLTIIGVGTLFKSISGKKSENKTID